MSTAHFAIALSPLPLHSAPKLLANCECLRLSLRQCTLPKLNAIASYISSNRAIIQ
ncbi:hypothetical protein [Argonema antarcticum]|uniref:hypothetical protein n=1 Tax=Argonema antarcticum TaxID=2942763 RepID=UPI0020133B40|nr:hypothetical protein [Argonema antarcticum]MCL1475171.1 hypothetical protein [Argonema antarcticum A004/B2]